MVNFFTQNSKNQEEKGNGFRFSPTNGDTIAKSITTRAGNRMDDNFITVPNATKKGYIETYEGDSVDLAYPNSTTRRGRVKEGVSGTLTTSDNMGVVVSEPQIRVIGNYSPSNHDASRIVDVNGIAPTVKENHGTVTAVNVTESLRIRKLTPKECWRLMGFDDEDFYKAESVNSNTQLYKQAGNSIVVNVLEAIFENLKDILCD